MSFGCGAIQRGEAVKPISGMTLPEALTQMRNTVLLRSEMELCDRIHELTRWIPVSERMPTQEDGLIRCIDGEYAESEFTAKFEKGVLKRWTIGDFDNMGWYKVESYDFTHWQRITPPETR